jgi:regulator of protease activity HflC (stomatin/prohibitin superfamily)
MKKILAVIVAVVGLMFMTGCSSVSTAADQVALHYEGGSFSSKKFAGCVPTSKKDYAGPGDSFFVYPTNQRFVDATGGDNSDFGAITVVSKDNVEMRIPVTLNFYLRTDCDTLRSFHETVGNRFQAYMDGDTTGDGWKNMLRVTVYQPMDTTLDRIAQQYNWRDLYNKPEVKAEIEKSLNENIEAIVRRQTNNRDFFNNWSALVQKPTPTNAELSNAIAAEQNNVESAQAAKAKAEADIATARAQKALAEAEAAKKRAEIAGYGGFENYNKNQAVEKGLNPYQPTYIVSGTKP